MKEIKQYIVDAFTDKVFPAIRLRYVCQMRCYRQN